MLTGQISSQALQVVQDHSSSDVIRSKRLSAVTLISASVPTGGDVGGRARRVHDLAGLQHDLAGVERLARRVRGAHRRAPPADRARVRVEELLPGEVLDRRRAERLELGLHEVRHLAHRALGPRPVLQVHVHRARDHVAQHRGRQDHEEREERDDVGDPRPAVRVAAARERPAVDDAGEPPTDEGPLLEARARAQLLAQRRDAERLGGEAGDRDHEERHQDDEVLGLGLDPDPVRPLPVAAGERPQDARR